MKWIGRPLAEIWPFEIFKIERSVVNIIYTSYTDLIYSSSLRWGSARGVNKNQSDVDTDNEAPFSYLTIREFERITAQSVYATVE